MGDGEQNPPRHDCSEDLETVDNLLTATSGSSHCLRFGLSRFQFRLILLLAPCYGIFTIYTMLPVFLIPRLSAWGMDKATIAAIGVAFFAGHLCGVIVGGLFADSFGRHKCLVLALLIASVAGPATFACNTPSALGAMRFLAGISAGAIINSAIVIMMEFAPTEQRFRSKGFIAVTGWSLCLLVFILVAYLTRGLPWQWLGICTLPALPLFLLALCVIPESPRYLHGYGDEAAALALLRGAAATNRAEPIGQVCHRALWIPRPYVAPWRPGRLARLDVPNRHAAFAC